MPAENKIDHPMPANPYARDAVLSLATTQHAVTLEQQNTLIAAGAVRAQLAVAYELNTIGRILAQQAEIIQPVNAKHDAAKQHNAILERLGL